MTTPEKLSPAKEAFKSEKVFVNAQIDERHFLFDYAYYKHLINGIKSFCNERKRSCPQLPVHVTLLKILQQEFLQ